MFWVSCQKENFVNGSKVNANDQIRTSGVIEDDPVIVSKVPMVVSSGFLANNKDISRSIQILAAKGRQDNTLPTVSISSPVNGASISGAINVLVNASDNVGVSSVSLSVDGSVVASSSTSPYTFPWNSATASNGTHTLTATAKDAAGNTKAFSIQVSVNNIAIGDIAKPTVNITSPVNGSSVTGTVSVAVTATDNTGVSSVQLSADGTVVGALSGSPYTFSWNTSTVATGVHTLTATANDAAGNTGSISIQVTVNTTVLPPTPIPASFQLVTPTPGNQGYEGSCVPFAIAYAARSIEQYYKTNATSYSFALNIFSPEYAYNQTKFGDCGTGTSITVVLDLIKNQGVSTWQSMPYSDINGCSLQPDASQIANASAYKISSYVTIPNTDQVAIKTMVASKHPVITTIISDDGFGNAGPGFIWKSYSGSGAGPHTLLICGYDDSKHAYKVMNSWGTTWGDAGFSWIDYDYFPQVSAFYTYAIQ